VALGLGLEAGHVEGAEAGIGLPIPMSNRVQEALGEGEDLREGGEESWTGEEGGNKQEDGAAVERLYEGRKDEREKQREREG
jgi:hypothetical protein